MNAFRAAVVFVLISSVISTPYEPCIEDDMPEPIALRVKDCDQPPCQLIRGEDTYAEVDFKPSHDITSLVPWVEALVLGAAVNYTLPEQDGCKSLKDQQCPLKKDEMYTFLLDLPILKIYPPVTFKVRLALLDADTQETMSCFMITGKVK